MKVWQAGSAPLRGAGRQGRRLVVAADAAAHRGCSIGLALPYRARTVGAVVSLLAYTLVALVPPLLAKLAVDQGIKTGDLQTLVWIVAAFVVVGLLTFALSSLQTVPDRLGG